MSEMTFFEAALEVLEEAGGGPLHYKDIAKRALQSGYLKTEGVTPEASMGAQIYTHIKRAEAIGENAKVIQVGRGIFALSRKIEKGALKTLKESNVKVRKELQEKLKEIHPRAFENLIGLLLSNIGFENVRVSKYSGDGGLDVEAELTVGGVTNVKTAVQVKRWKNKVTGKTVRELRGGLLTDQRGLIITTSSFTKDAIKEAHAEGKTPISLVDGEKLLELLIEHDLGVTKKQISYLELNLDQLGEFEEEKDVTTSGQALGLWPLPGGTSNYVESAVEMLKYVAQAEPSKDDMIEWMQKNFEKVQSEKTISGYIRVLKTLGLIYFDGEIIKIAENGSEALTEDPNKIILNQLRSNIAGINEYLEKLKENSMTLKESHDFFKETIPVTWETDAQTKFRLLWLENVGAIRKEGEYYHLI